MPETLNDRVARAALALYAATIDAETTSELHRAIDRMRVFMELEGLI